MSDKANSSKTEKKRPDNYGKETRSPSDVKTTHLSSQEKLVDQLAQAKVMFVGRSLPEYYKMFNLDLESLKGKSILDVAGGPASFTREMADLGYDVSALDIMYYHTASDLRSIVSRELEDFSKDLSKDSPFPQNNDFAWLVEDPLEQINTPAKLLQVRKRGLELFCEDFELDSSRQVKRYVAAALPHIEALSNRLFDLILVGNLLFAYSKNQGYDYDFHFNSIVSLSEHLNSGGKIEIYPYGDEQVFDFPLEKLRAELYEVGLNSEPVESEHRFVKGWTHMLTVWRSGER